MYIYIATYIIIISTGVATLKKHYNNLWMSLPEDHIITLGRFYEFKMYALSDDIIDQITSSTNSQWSNKKLLNLMISITKNDYQLLGLSFLIQGLAIGDISVTDCPHIELFRNGRFEDNQHITQPCMYRAN